MAGAIPWTLAQRPEMSRPEGRAVSLRSHEVALDGLRGFAILGVLMLHAGLLPGGGEGVTVFFTLSGFLITRLLMTEASASGAIDLRTFFRRRCARLVPALIPALCAVTVLAMVRDRGHILGVLSWGLLPAITYTSDISMLHSGWSGVGLLFQWSWSLAIEEQFYFLWAPLCCLLLPRPRGRRALSLLGLSGVLVPLVLRLLWADNATVATHRLYFAPDTRADAIFLGSLLAIFLYGRGLGPTWARCCGLLGFVALVLSYLFAAQKAVLTFKVGLPISESAAAAIIVSGLYVRDGAVCQIFSQRWLVSLGRVSYSLYLWNLVPRMLFIVVTGHDADLSASVFLEVASLPLGLLSYRYVEQPARARLTRKPAVTRAAQVDVLVKPAPDEELAVLASRGDA